MSPMAKRFRNGSLRDQQRYAEDIAILAQVEALDELLNDIFNPSGINVIWDDLKPRFNDNGNYNMVWLDRTLMQPDNGKPTIGASHQFAVTYSHEVNHVRNHASNTPADSNARFVLELCA
jgi:hypothetical protein